MHKQGKADADVLLIGRDGKLVEGHGIKVNPDYAGGLLLCVKGVRYCCYGSVHGTVIFGAMTPKEYRLHVASLKARGGGLISAEGGGAC